MLKTYDRVGEISWLRFIFIASSKVICRELLKVQSEHIEGKDYKEKITSLKYSVKLIIMI